ncbi:hypothetical protein EYF80_037506 [Liparis tanakae]|uniref:Uncharacterized protein n=1 Tax=Liparis tanakae TaxID=230148 RepID=A0A4Z2GFV0_9TELE|nr:hypothetical protein EYF80_037506 [Liparis tanakae]
MLGAYEEQMDEGFECDSVTQHHASKRSDEYLEMLSSLMANQPDPPHLGPIPGTCPQAPPPHTSAADHNHTTKWSSCCSWGIPSGRGSLAPSSVSAFLCAAGSSNRDRHAKP